VKEDTSKLKEIAFTPYTYISSTYQDEYSKTQGQGIVKTGKAFVSTELKVAHDALNIFLSYWSKSKEHTAKKVDEIKQ
jgi:chaperonin cofactor prefoldin